jgi:hypothetical protein
MPRPRPLQCPFCSTYLIRPVEIRFKAIEITGGICRCGAIYAFDRTGHSLGEIYLDAMTFLCRGDLDMALSLNPEDYEDISFDYDYETNRLDARSSTGRAGKILFMRLKQRLG